MSARTERNGSPGSASKKLQILLAAQELETKRYTAAEIEQIRRQLIARMGARGKTSPDYIVSVLQHAGLAVVLSHDADTQGRYEEEFADLLRFSTLEEAEMSIVRLDELLRKFQDQGDRHAAERAREIGRLGRRRAEMIARNRNVEPAKRAEKEEIASWFAIWLETPSAFFDWLEVRKQSPEFQSRFAASLAEESE